MTAHDIPFASKNAERLQRIAEGRYLFAEPDLSTDIEVSHVRVERGELRARVKVYCGLAGTPTVDGVLFASEITLSRFSGRRELAGALDRRTKLKGVNWYDKVDELAIRVENAEATRTPVTDLSRVPVPAPGSTPTCIGGIWPLFLHDPNAVFGKGGDGKSLLATWAAGELQRMGIPSLIADYEMTEDPQAARLVSLFGPDRPAVSHYRATRPLIHEVDRLEAIVHERGIQFVVVDSCAPAASGNVNDADVATAYYGALRRLRVGSLTVAHVTKASTAKDANPDDATPYGSAFWWNLARSAWHLRRANQDDDRLTIGLFHAKHNYTAKHPPIGLDIVFRDGRAHISKVELADVPNFSASLSIQQRVRHALKHGPRSMDELAAELEDQKVDSIKRVIHRYTKGNVVMFHRLPDDRIALAEMRRTP
jgi:hypothetical protein